MSRHTSAAGAVLVALTAVLIATMPDPPRLGWYALLWALFAAALWLARRVPDGPLTVLVMAGGIVLAASGLTAPPSSSTDAFRYAWDGRVQAAGVSPYDHAPADPGLVPLRDDWLFPSDCAARDLWPLPEGRCTRINRPTVHTIYPPLAQGYFLLVHWLSPEGVRHKALQAGGALMAVVVLLALCRQAGARTAAFWAWCPAVPIEAVNNAHIDMLGVLLVVLAFFPWRRPRGELPGSPSRSPSGSPSGVLAGVLLGAGAAAKLLPATALPGALSGIMRGDRLAGIAWGRVLRVAVPAALVVAVAYLPYALGARAPIVGFLPGYVSEEGYGQPPGGNRYVVLRLLLPGSWAPYAAILLLALIVLHVLRHGDPERPWHGALLISGSLLLLFTPGYSWYALLVVALAAMDGRWEWLGVALAGAMAYVAGPMAHPSPAAPLYALAALAVLVGWAVRGAEQARDGQRFVRDGRAGRP